VSTLDVTLAVSITGILVSGVVGPQLTVWSTRRADRRQFNRDQAAHRREDLRSLLDEAAVLLASGATNLRLLRSVPTPEIRDWLGSVFPLGQRLRLRLPGDDQVVAAYNQVREALAAAAEQPGNDVEAAIVDFEHKRELFLDLSREALSADIPDRRDALR
jgi:hypothetical protein